MISIFLSCIFVFLFLYVIVDLFSRLDDILEKDIAISMLVSYYLSFIPLIFIQVSPMACLLSMLYSLGNLSRNNEIIAMRASGLSALSICRPILLFGVLLSIFIFTINERLIPKMQSFNYKLETKMFETNKPQKEKLYNLAIYGQNNKHFFIDVYYPKRQMMENVVILEHDEQQNVISKIVAKDGFFRGGRWLFRKCIIYYFGRGGKLLGEPFYFPSKFMSLKDRPEDFLRQQKKRMFMNIGQLKDYIKRLSNSGAAAVLRDLKVDLYNRFTSPFSSLVIIIVGIPFALGAKKRGQAIASLGLCIGISFLYYVFNQTSIAMGKLGAIPPLLSALLSHAFFVISSIIAIFHLP